MAWLVAAGTVGVLTAAAARYLRSEARLEAAAAKLPLTPMRRVADGVLVKVAGIVDPESARLLTRLLRHARR